LKQLEFEKKMNLVVIKRITFEVVEKVTIEETLPN